MLWGSACSAETRGGRRSASPRWTDECVRPYTSGSDLQNYRHDQRAFLGLLGDVAFQVGANFFFDYAVVAFFFIAGMGQRVFNDALSAFHEAVVAGVKATGDDFRGRFRFSR